ncbi:hypothetical protein MCQ_01487 [Candidatus Bartonella washoeensis Sb944nv]|uniref:Uncharacterized protein n=1 Tax=Candidatus Bartonella washoeensis Sb944nv TaxID=1094563 RepID=J1J175_9HYPH|nr:hypothetical protein [Bartonella washoeensis]EJF77797.1 hypothetical protein MCQ_01487 [Bartonella washoeensis Sb944nv]
MNAETTEEMEGMNEDYTAEQPVFDDDGYFDGDTPSEQITSDDISSQEPVSQPVHEASEISTVEEQHAEEQARQAREALMQFYDQQSQETSVDGDDIPPDLVKDPVGYIQRMEKKIQEQDAFIKEYKEAQRQAFVQQQYDRYLNQFLENSVKAVEKKYSDFGEAAHFLYEARAKELYSWSGIYPEYAEKSTIDAIIGNNLRTVLATCAQNGTNPAEELYRVAEKLGYKNQAIEANNQVAALQSRQNSARTLTASGGGGSTGPITLETINAMSDKQFNAWIENPKNEEIFYRLTGVSGNA